MRVPLNTALLAVQNMQASGIVAQDIEFKALEGSLSMMSKGASRLRYFPAACFACVWMDGNLTFVFSSIDAVLNDVLDL